jgi:hypothetical protein
VELTNDNFNSLLSTGSVVESQELLTSAVKTRIAKKRFFITASKNRFQLTPKRVIYPIVK